MTVKQERTGPRGLMLAMATIRTVCDELLEAAADALAPGLRGKSAAPQRG